MSGFENLYELLDVPENAGSEDIEAAIQAQRRIWIKRQNSADPAKQIEAQTRVTMLDRATKTLLKEAARSSYDRELAQERATMAARKPAYSGGETSASVPVGNGPTAAEWIKRAFDYYRDGAGPNVVKQALDEAQKLDRSDPDGWMLRGVVQQQLGNATQAEVSYREALTRDPQHVEALIFLSGMESERGQHNRARERAMEATRIAPNDLRTHVNLGEVFINADQPGEAIRYLKPVVAAHQEEPAIQQTYARAVYHDTLEQLTLSENGRHFTSMAQVKYAKEHLPAALLAAKGHEGLETAIEKLLLSARKAARISVVNFRRHWWKLLLFYLVFMPVLNDAMSFIFTAGLFAALCVRRNTYLHAKYFKFRAGRGINVKWGIK